MQAALFRIATQRATAFEWETALAWWRAVERLAHAVGNDGRWAEAYACTKGGDILVILGAESLMLWNCFATG